MRYVLFIFLFLILSGCATPGRFYDKTTGISANSSDVIYGVRFYEGKLPKDIVYESLGRLEACGIENFSVPPLRDARDEMAQRAKKMGANAIINIRAVEPWGEMCLEAQAIKAKNFPDALPQETDIVRSETVYRNSRIFKAEYASVFAAAKSVLQAALYDIAIGDEKRGVIETKEREIAPDKMRWRAKDLGGPYPVLKIKLILKKISDEKTEIIKIDAFRGYPWREKVVKQNSGAFFAEITRNLKPE